MAGRQVLAVAVVLVVLVVGVRANTSFAGCTHNEHCENHSCCLVGFTRYSIPACSPRGGVGSPCSPTHSEPSSRTLHYPNDMHVVMEEAHFGLCPCSSGLVCSMGKCQVPEQDDAPSVESNSLNSEYEY